MGVKRLQVAMSPLRSYSKHPQVSWSWMVGLKVILRAARLRGVPGMLLEPPLAYLVKDRK